MAKSKKLKEVRAQQMAAAEVQFEAYKDFIVEKFIEKFGGSYQTAETMRNTWRDTFVFRPEYEAFLLSKTRMFLLLLEDTQSNKSPCFLRTLTGLISQYLSKYICKKGISSNDCTQQLMKILFTNNTMVQNKIKNYLKDVAVFNKKQKGKFASKKQADSRYEKVAEAVHTITKKRARHMITLKINVSELVK